MIPLSTNAVRFTPDFPWYDQTPDEAPVYLIRPGSVFDRDELEAELVARRAGRVLDLMLYEAARNGVRAWKLGDDEGRFLELIDQHQAGQVEDPAEVALFTQLEAMLVENWPPYGELYRQQARRRQMAPTIAALMFLRGWENGPGEFKSGVDGRVTADTLKLIPPLDLKAIGAKAYHLLYGEDDTAKNSEPPSKSASARKTSASASSRRGARKGGKSTARATD